MKNLAFLLLFLASPIFAEVPTLKLPAEVKGEPGTFIAIRAETDSAWVNFKADPGLAVFPANLLSDRKATVLTAARPGRYKLFAYTGNEDGGADAEVLIVIGNAPPVVVVPPVDPTVPPVDPTVPPTTKATAATYVTQKGMPVPPPVLSAIDDLNTQRKILATIVLSNTTDGTGEPPEQYKVAFAAAKDAGLPALVFTAGKVVLKVVKNPKTEDDVLKAVP